MLNTDMVLKWDAELHSHVVDFAEDVGGTEEFYEHFVSGWVKVMNADLFGDDYVDIVSFPSDDDDDDDDGDDSTGAMVTTAAAGISDDTMYIVRIHCWYFLLRQRSPN